MSTPPKKHLKPYSKKYLKRENFRQMEAKLLKLQPLAAKALILMGKPLPEEKAS